MKSTNVASTNIPPYYGSYTMSQVGGNLKENIIDVSYSNGPCSLNFQYLAYNNSSPNLSSWDLVCNNTTIEKKILGLVLLRLDLDNLV